MRATRATCIYCMQTKDMTGFTKVEHVLPQSFGLFKENLTLKDVVCDACNGFFGKTIDLALARGSIDGLDRIRFGTLPASEFKHLGARTARIDSVAQGPLKGVRATWEADEHGELRAKPLPQLGFRRTTDNERVWLLLHELPTSEQAAAMHLSTDDVLTQDLDEGDIARLNEQLAPRGGQCELFSQHTPGGYRATLGIESKQVFDAEFFRAIAKIGLNYVASQWGADAARMSTFERARRYALHGEGPGRGWYTVDHVPVLAHLAGQPGHFVRLVWNAQESCLIAQVSFHNQRRYQVRLTEGELRLGESMQSCHVYDLSLMKVRLIRV